MNFLEIEEAHYPQVAEIYRQGLETRLATFETSVPEWAAWNKSRLPFGRIGLEENGQLLGWGSLTPVSSRHVYRGVAEISVYISAENRGKGLGEKLLNKLIAVSEENALWTLQAGIMRANKASINLHKKCGFRVIGYREKIGELDGVWLDNIIMERRSRTTGI
ncbi:MAG: N-acetyltransferase family protein [Salegentibacter sp.]